MKKENSKKVNVKNQAGFIIILICVIVSIIGCFGSHLWLSNLDFSEYSRASIDGSGFDANGNNGQTIDVKNLFSNKYNQILQVLSSGIAHGTTWLTICPNSQIEVGNDIYIEVCSDEYNSVAAIKNSLSGYVTDDYIEHLMEDNYLDKNGKLYIKPVFSEKNEEYLGFVSYNIVQKTQDKIVFLVKSKYQKQNCDEKCDTYYEEHKFILMREENEWLVSNIEMPY